MSPDAQATTARPGRARVALAARAGRTRLVGLDQEPPLRVLFPRPAAADLLQAVVLNTGGGIVAGDRLAIDVAAASGAAGTVTTAAAEKVYRSPGPEAALEVTLRAADGAWLEWLPQETILFDRARFRRRSLIERSGRGCVLAAEITVFGRHAMGERFERGLFGDRIEVRADGRLGFLDVMKLDRLPGRLLDHPHAFAGAGAAALLVFAAADAAGRIDEVRAGLDPAGGRAGASAIGEVLVVRWLSPSPLRLRHAVAATAAALRATVAGLPSAVPRVWWT